MEEQKQVAAVEGFEDKPFGRAMVQLTTELEGVAIKAKHLMVHKAYSEPEAYDQQHGEMRANTMLAIRDIESAVFRLNRARQYQNDIFGYYRPQGKSTEE